MEIKPTDLTVKQLLDSGFYKIPRFQRPYSWDRENVEDFWNDAVVADDAGYFIGSFVVYKGTEAYGPLYLVDGQQRFTTITILLAAVRDALDARGFKPQATGVQQLIERSDINAVRQFVLQTETSYPYLQEHIQKYGPAETSRAHGRRRRRGERAKGSVPVPSRTGRRGCRGHRSEHQHFGQQEREGKARLACARPGPGLAAAADTDSAEQRG